MAPPKSSRLHPKEKIDAALAEYDLRKASGVPVAGLGKKFGVNDSTIYWWINRRKEEGANAAPPAAPPAENNRLRKEYPLELKQAALEAYVTRGKGVTAQNIAARFGIANPHMIHAWAGEMREGRLLAKPQGKPNGGAQLAMAHVTIEPAPPQAIDAGPATGMAHMRIQQLEAEVKMLRKVLRLFVGE